MFGGVVIVGALLSGLFIWRVIMSSPHSIGKAGERHVARKLSWLPKEYIVLNDIMLKTRYGTTQIDHVIVSPYGIFVIETKNYKGWIFGHENSEEWKQSLLGKKRMWGWSSENHAYSVQQAQQRKRQMVANGICPQCCSALVERDGKYGRFLGCSNYPRCKFTSPLD